MALRRENYTQMGLCILVYVFSILSLSAQDQACPIWADLEPIADQRMATPTVYSQSMSMPFYDWNQLDSCRYSDNQYTRVTLPRIHRSEVATFSRWGHQIPAGASIQGIRLDIEGHQTGEGKIRDVQVQLDGSNQNKAGQYLGVAFPDSIDQVWRYGGSNDTWGRNWTASDINSNNFGLIYQVRNSIGNSATLHIDRISIEVFYMPMYTVCNDEHACVAFGVDEVSGYNYNWDIPLGFERLSSLNEQYAVNIGATTSANFGEYEICVDVYDQNGSFAENCCRSFNYKDCRPAFIGNQVFLDNNHDNIFSIGDEAVTGVDVFLFDEFDNLITQTTTDDEDGMYQFEVPQGNYYIKIALPNGTVPIEPNVGSDNSDSDLTGANGPLTTSTFFAGAGINIDNIDIGLARELIIGDRVWEDKNYNGIQDADEIGISGIEVLLNSSNGVTLKSTLTDQNGLYSFDNIRVDDYELIFISNETYLSTLQGMGTEEVDSDINENGSTGNIDFNILDMPYLDIDAGFYRYASVGDFVFFDENENGIQDSEDVGIPNIVVTLSSISGEEIETVISDAEGTYLFDSLTPGQYIITSQGTELIKPTLLQAGGDITLDNDLIDNEGNYSTNAFTLMSNESNPNIDLGWIDNLADLGGVVFEDIKYDGQFNITDILLSDISVQLISVEGTLIQNQITNEEGRYLFEDVYPGSYYIKFDLGGDYQFTQSNIGDDISDSDVTSSVEIGSTDLLVVSVGMESLNIDAGAYLPTSIGDYIFLDLNEDGIQNVGDSGLSDIEVVLLDHEGQEIAVSTSDEVGAYLFDNLVPSEYSITINSSDLYLATMNGVGTSETDSDLLGSNGEYFSEAIVTCSGQQIDTIDFGFIYNYAELSGQLFEDIKADGILSIDDTLLVSVPVLLFSSTGDLIQSATTDDQGNYTFIDVLAGDYFIQYGLTSEYIYTTNNVTESNGEGTTDVFSLSPGEVKLDDDTGAYVPGTIGDYVFLDINENGIQDASDISLSGIQLTLLDATGSVVQSTVSMSDGSYSFMELVPGNYTIALDNADLYLATESNAGDKELDSDLLGTVGDFTSSLITICSGQLDSTIDFGFVINFASVSGQIFEDSKADGVLNGIDTSIANVMVTLYDDSNQITQTTTTDINGNFSFENVLVGNYYLVYGLSSQYIYTTENVTGDNGSGSTSVFTLTPGEMYMDQTTGAYIPATIGDYVFLDLNENGVQDMGDEGLEGISLSLVDGSGAVVDMITTSSDGMYNFTHLIPGNYTINVDLPNLYLPTELNVGQTDLDSDLMDSMGNFSSDIITVCSGQNEETIDFGFVINFGSISGQVFEDSKADGVLNGIDTSIANVMVTLYDDSNQITQTTTTDINGNFSFENVLVGNYYLVYGLSSQYIYTTENVTGDNGSGSTQVFALAPGEMYIDQTTGAYIPATIGDYVFLDLNENGVQDMGDEGLEGISLSLVDGSGAVVDMITTSSDGMYNFTHLIPGNYTINVDLPNLYLPTELNVGQTDLDSDLMDSMGNFSSDIITVCSGQNEETIDFGFVINFGSISGQIFEDSKADGVLNGIDTFIANVMVTLYDDSNQIAQTTTTDSNGNFAFAHIVAGQYYLVYGLDGSYIYTSPEITEAFGLGSTDEFVVSPGESQVIASVGAYREGSIGDYVFLDLNENGIQDLTDQALEGIKLDLFDQDGSLVATSTSSTTGSYTFANLTPGDYSIVAAVSDLYLVTESFAGDSNLDSDLLFGSGLFATNTITICSGQNDVTIDLGLINNYGQISGTLFEDSKANGIFDEPDTMIVDAIVDLYTTSDILVQSTLTKSDGSYVFEDVLEGNYYILYRLSSDYIFSTMDVTDANGEGTTDVFSIAAGESISNSLTGVYLNASIGDFVFLDLNENGRQDPEDIGVAGIEIQLFDITGTLVNIATSTSTGAYNFEGLMPGEYSFSVSAPNIYLATMLNIGDENNDSDLLFGSGLFGLSDVTVCSGQNMNSIDLGLINNYARISGSIFEDSKANGILDTPDTMLAGVRVDLYNFDASLAQSTTTDANGAYSFEDVLTGDYYILYDLSSGYIFSTSGVTGAHGIGTTDLFTLAPGASIDNDAVGAYRNASIGDFVFLDLNENGIQDALDFGLEGVFLELFDQDGNLINTATSNEQGAYSFEDLMPGIYSIIVSSSDLYLATLVQAGAEGIDSDLIFDNGLLSTESITICSGQNNNSIDLGFINNYAQITGSLFEDTKANGVLDDQDSMKVNALIELYNTDGLLIQSTMTAIDGSYVFDNVLAGKYYIQYNLSQSYIYSTIDITNGNGNGTTDIITLIPGESFTSIATGAYRNVSIGDLVFLDADDNGIQSMGDSGLSGVQLILFDDQGINQETIMTDENGAYIFENIPPGNYVIEAQFSNLYIPTQYQMGDENLDSDLRDFNGTYISDTINICSGQMFDNIDFGVANNYGQIGGVVFTDMLRDGQLMSMDVLLPGITVTLFSASNVELASTETDQNGEYLFENLLVGDYYVVFDLEDRLITLANVGDDAIDSDITETNGVGSTDLIMLAPGEINLTISAGAYELASIGDFVWFDQNRNGLQDDGEPGIADIMVNLYNETSVLLATDATDINGIYGFGNLVPGIYYIEVEYPEDLKATMNTMVDLTLNSDITDAMGEGTTDFIILTSGTDNLDIDAGLGLIGAEIHGEVWVDQDGDEMQGMTESLLANIPVKLFDADSNEEIFSTETNQNGKYSFKPIIEGNYYIQFEIADTLLYITAGIGDEAVDSDVSNVTNGIGTTDIIQVTVAEVITDIDAGVKDAKSQITGLVFIDRNGDGINQDTEINLDSYTVNLHSADGSIVKSVMADMDGTYILSDIATGDYYVSFSGIGDFTFTSANEGGDDTIDSDVTELEGEGTTDIFTLGILDTQVLDAGVFQLGSIGDFVWLDANDNGIQDTDEMGVAMVNLEIIDVDGVVVDMLTTGEDGSYIFADLVPGEYVIQAQFESQYLATIYQQGDEDLDSDLQDIDGVFTSPSIVISSDENIDNIDFGLANNYSEIGGLVFEDMMRDGQFNGMDQGLEGVSVSLFNTDNIEVAATVSDIDGNYVFSEILSGDYFVIFDLEDRISTLSDIGNDETDSDVTDTNGLGSSEIISLAPGESNLTIYAGAYELASIGNFVWSDDNRNGLQDIDELGIAGVEVSLYNDMSAFVTMDVTDANGIYGFENLIPGLYYIQVVYPQDLTSTINTLSDLTLNSDLTDDNGPGTTDFISLTSGMENLDIDAGLGLSGAEIRGEVWLDVDGNEMQGSTETLMPNIPVKLFNADTGEEIFTTATNQNGSYSFKPLSDGNYYVQFEITDTLVFVTSGVGNEVTDSDVTNMIGQGTTDIISVSIGDVISDIDAGVQDGRSQVGGVVFIDKNGDGINDVTEDNIDMYTVNLHTVEGTIISSVMSEVDGSYTIMDIVTGDYYLTFTDLSDYVFTSADTGEDDMIDSDVTESQAIASTDVFSLGIQDAQVYDAGVYLLGSIGDFVWLDANANGLQDTEEVGVELASLTIFNMNGEVLKNVITGVDGTYLFDSLAPGRYVIEVEVPSGFITTDYQIGDDDSIDSDLLMEGTLLFADTIMIMSGQDDLSIDFGLVQNPASIEGFVWNDINVDGIFNDEIGTFDAVTVELYSAITDMLIASTSTDADGGYNFSNVSPNDYYIKFVLNENTNFTIADQGGDDDVDSDVTGDNGDGTTDTFMIVAGQSINNIYAGLIFPAKIGNLVFMDSNSNGIQDGDEPGIADFKVILYSQSGMKLDSVNTDALGLFTFTDLDPASYYLEFVYSDEIQPTIAIPMMPALNSDITGANGRGTTDLIFLGSGVCNEDIDGGFVNSGAVIVGEVWLDTNEDNIQDNPNNPVEGIEVSLFRTGGILVDGPVMTNELGMYGFSSVPTGAYYVQFDIPESLEFVTPNVGPADTDSDVTNLMGIGTTFPFTVSNGQLYEDVDAGVREIITGSIVNGQLFIDSDGDGIKDMDNQGLEGVDVTIFDFTGAIGNTVTDENGFYSFQGLQPNFYTIEFSNYPSTYEFTEANVGGDDTVDSDVTFVDNGIGAATVIIAIDETLSIDGGVYELASVGDYVWIDENNNGIQDPMELPLMGVLVEAVDADFNVLGSATTDASGMYLIEGLVPGTYNLIFTGVENYVPTIANLGGDDSLDSDINVTTGQQAATGTFDLISGEVNLDFDAGYIFAQPSNGTISGWGWIDDDVNGIREATDPVIPNLGVILFNELGIEQASTTTNSQGEYSFTGLSDGMYYVLFQNEIGTTPTTPNIGSEEFDSDITKAFGGSSTDIINLGPSEVVRNIDGGFIFVGAIGNQIFVDINGNGRKSGTEPGLNGVTVNLFEAVSNTLVQTTISSTNVSTSEQGFYQFDDVQMGSYYLVFELPEPYLFTDPNRGTDESLDSDVTGLTNGPGSTEVFDLATGQVRANIDAGAFLPAQIGDFVWNDINGDGLQDAGEPGIPNVMVELKRSNGAPVASTTTDENGNYCFTDLKQGLYFLEFEVPNGFVVSEIYQGDDSAIDSDVDPTGVTPLVSIAHGSSFKQVDAGFSTQSINTLISHVWLDENGNGIFEEEETMMREVVLTLLDDQGVEIAQTMTNLAGKYAFADIPEGDYQISVTVDAGYATTIMNVGTNDLIDSDVDANGMSAMFSSDTGISVPNIDIGLILANGIAPEISGGFNTIDGPELEEDQEDEFGQEESPLSFVSGPNPFYNRVQLRMSKLVSGVTYTIYRFDGVLVQSGEIVEKDQWIDLESYIDGMYILMITHGDDIVDKQYLMKVN